MRDKFVISPALGQADDIPSQLTESHGDETERRKKSEVTSGKTSRNDVEADSETAAKCGWLWFRPWYLQKFRTAKWALFWLCWAGAMQGMVVNGFINVVITTIEKRFGLRSSQTGLIAGGYDIASFFLLVPVSYLGGRSRASKPRYIGAGVVALGLGSLVFAAPHYIAGIYRGGQQSEIVCRSVANSSVSSSSSCDFNDDPRSTEIEPYSGLYLGLFLAAQLLHGAGAAPFFTLGVTYIDENVSKKMSSVYLGIYYTMAVIGPALGYVIGGELLKIYTDFLVIDAGSIGLTPDTNVWIGAWWIGFIAAAAVCFAIAIPLLAFPAILPGSEELAKDKISEAHRGGSCDVECTGEQAFSKIRQMPAELAELLKNPAFFMLNLAGASEGLLIAGFATFLPKLIENQFTVTASSAALLMGVVTVPAGGGGTFIGGYLVKRWNLTCSGILKFCLSATAACILFTLCFALNCPNLAFAGLTVPYHPRFPSGPSEGLNLESSCNSKCGCSTGEFNPICGVDGITYYSPCHAGCHRENAINGVKIYGECSCIDAVPLNLTNVWFSDHVDDSDAPMTYEAINTTCESNCGHLWLFVVLAFGIMFLTFLCTMPALSSTLRVVRDEQRSFALGIQWIKVRILGTIPAPIIFGALIDDTCILWQAGCEGRGACLVYDNLYMSRYMLALAFIGKAASLLFFFMAWWFYVPPVNGRKSISVEPPREQTVSTIGTSENGMSHPVDDLSSDLRLTGHPTSIAVT